MITPDSRQIRKVGTLPKLGTGVNASVETVLNQVNIEVDSPLRLFASATPDALLNFASSLISAADLGKKVVSPVKKQIFSTLSSPWINFQTQAVSNAADFDITFPASTVGQFRHVGFTLIGSGKIKALFSAENVVEANLSNPGALFVNGGLPLGYVTLECTNILGYFKTATSVTNVIESAKIFRLAAGGGGSSSATSGAGGGELADLMYSAQMTDSFVNIPDGTTTVDISAAKTDATLHDVANELIRLSYDASKTMTGTGTAMTLSGTPAFTVKTGDVVMIGTEVRAITALSSQTAYTIEAAFTTNPAATACTVSQAVHTVDLNAFTAGGLGLAASSQYSGNIDEIMVGYQDTTTLGDIIPDFGTAPVIGFVASSDASSWTSVKTRTTSLSSQEAVVLLPTASTQLKMRFFANVTSSSGAVNLLGYKVFFQKQLGNVTGASYLTAFARPTASITNNCTIGLVSGKTRFTFSWAYTPGVNSTEPSGSVLEVIANGQIIPRFTSGVTDSTQAYFTEINDSTIEMDTDYSSAGIDFQFKVQRIGIIDTNTLNTTKIALHDDLLDQSLDAQVMVPFLTAINGSPTAGVSFRSDITGRANIPDLSSMLSVQMGPQRMMTQEIYQLQNEFGSAGQPVFGVVNDKFNQIRFIGSWSNNNTSDGQRITTSVVGDYVEIIFYGTGLNYLTEIINGAGDTRVSVDGGSEGSNIYTNGSNIIIQRNYSTNQIVNAVSGLSLGLHTVKIRYAAVALPIYGFEVLTETTSLRVMPGTVAKGKYKNVLSAMQTVAYDSNFETGTLGTKGGCVLLYLKNDGTIGKALTPTDATALYLASASHANEEIVRTHYFREFGAGRADDFSGAITTSSSLAFTLDDGTTTLVGSLVRWHSSYLSMGSAAANGFVTFTFIGTGLDILQQDDGIGTDTTADSLYVDGTLVAGWSTSKTTTQRVTKICSGLPYGTHTIKIVRPASGTVANFGIVNFIVYGPKKPALPVGAIEQAQYYKMANYSSVASGVDLTSSGVIRKMNIREFIYTGTWNALGAPLTNVNNDSGIEVSQNGASALEYTFFGTGFDLKCRYGNGQVMSQTVSVDGVVNLSAYGATIVFNGVTGLTYNNVTGTITGTVTVSGTGTATLRLNGLPLGKHKLVHTNITAATGMAISSIDIITPIHAPTINGPYVLQNTLSLGNNGFLDLRKFNKRDIVLSNQSNVSSAVKLANSTTTSVSFVPNPDLSITHNTKTGKIRISHCGLYLATTGSTYWTIAIDGKIMKQGAGYGYTAPTIHSNASIITIENLNIGTHKIDVMYRNTGGTATSFNDGQTSSMLTVEDEE